MNILIVHEIDWFNKVIFEPHHFAELFSLKGHNVYAIDCSEPNPKNFFHGLQTRMITGVNRIYEGASFTVIRPPAILLKGLNRLSHYYSCEQVIRKTVIDNKIDIILLYAVATNGIQTVKIGKELNIPVIFRGLDVGHGLVKNPFLSHLVKKHEKIVYKNSKRILTTTKELAQYVIGMGIDEHKVEVFPYGINFRKFKPRTKDIKLAESLGISKNDKVIVFVGTFYDFSGLDEIIVKFSMLKQQIKNVKLLAIGGGPFFKTIRTLVKKKKLESDVILVGFKTQSDIPKYISLADVCVNSFRVNNVTERIIPAKVMEYLACKKPVISTPLKGTITILPNENYGVTYSPINNFVENLANLLKDEKKMYNMAESGYSYMKENFDWDVLTNQLLEKFDEMIKQN